jgi:hypothetical protein
MKKFIAAVAVTLLCACPGGTTTDTDGGQTTADGGQTGGGSDGGFVFIFKNHSFAFENYTNTPGIVNLTPVEVRRMFGDSVCAGSLTADSCELTPASTMWMEAQSNAMNGGHCEGMAVLAGLFATGALKPSDFGAPTAFELTLAGNTRLQREIGYWWATQSVGPTNASETKGANGSPPTEVVSRLKKMVESGGEVWSIGLYKRDMTGGHAVTPISTEERAGKQYIKVYENNLPNEIREFEVDPVANSWRYFASTNPNEPGALYDGDTSTSNLTLTPNSVRTMRQNCPTCGTVAADGKSVKGSAVSYREVNLSGDAHVLISDGAGHQIGYVAGAFVNTIPSATTGPVKRAPSTYQNVADPSYRLPLSVPLTVTLDGTALTADTTSNVIMTAPGYSFAVEGVVVHPTQKDTISFSAGTESVEYKTTATETPTVALGVTFDGADYLFEVKSAAETGGVDVELKLDATNGKLQVFVKSFDGAASYDIRIERRDTSATSVFTHAGNSIAAAAVVSFDYANWVGNGSPMSVGTDANGDGTIDSTEMVADQN